MERVTQTQYVYKAQMENDISGSLSIPRVEWPRDFVKNLEKRQHMENKYLIV
jgi:hypothetical protein